MAKRLFIAEKPAAAKALASFLSRTSGLPLSTGRLHYIVGNDIIGSLRGHVLGLVKPEVYDARYKTWIADDLPIVPQQFKLAPIESNKEYFETVQSLMKTCDQIVLFTDPDARGELIGRQVLYFTGNKKPVSRLWVSALNDAELAKAMAGIKPIAHYDGYYYSALAQDHADWLYGINMSRGCGIAASKRGATTTISVGRVQTPTLALVVYRELEIRNFKPVDYYVPWVQLGAQPPFRGTWMPAKDDSRLDAEGRLLDKAEAARIQAKTLAATTATIVGNETTKHKENPPLPFSLTTLQVFADKHFGLGAQGVLDLVQSLYDKKLVSYPRTDSQYLPESQHAEAPATLTSLAKAPLPTSFNSALRGAKPEIKSGAWSDKDVSAHHAIVPVTLDNPRDIESLSEVEKKVYLEIVRRFLLQFWPAAQFLKTEVKLECGGETFVARGKRYTDDGWRKAFAAPEGPVDKEDKEDAEDDAANQRLPVLSLGQVVTVAESGFDSITTKKPKRFTEGTLIAAMENVHKYVTDPKVKARLKEGAGIGTVATRGAIIKVLMDSTRQFVEKSGKFLVPTATGEKLITMLPPSMTAPDMTAMWGMFMDEILGGRATYDAFIEQQVIWLKSMVRAAEHFFDNMVFGDGTKEGKQKATVIETDQTCSCGAKLKHINGKYGWFWACSSESCKKTYRDEAGKPVEKTVLTHKHESGIACPRCKSGTLRAIQRRDGSGQFWGCSDYQKGCKATFNDINGAPDLSPKAAA